MITSGPGHLAKNGGADVLTLHCTGGRLHASHRVRISEQAVRAAVEALPLMDVRPQTVLHLKGHRVTLGAVRLATRNPPPSESRSALVTNLSAEFLLNVSVDRLYDSRVLVYAHASLRDDDETAEALCLPGRTVDALELVVHQALLHVPAESRTGGHVRIAELSLDELDVVLRIVGS